MLESVLNISDIVVASKQEIEASMFIKEIVRYYFPVAVIPKEKSFDPCKSERFYRKLNINHP